MTVIAVILCVMLGMAFTIGCAVVAWKFVKIDLQEELDAHVEQELTTQKEFENDIRKIIEDHFRIVEPINPIYQTADGLLTNKVKSVSEDHDDEHIRG